MDRCSVRTDFLSCICMEPQDTPRVQADELTLTARLLWTGESAAPSDGAVALSLASSPECLRQSVSSKKRYPGVCMWVIVGTSSMPRFSTARQWHQAHAGASVQVTPHIILPGIRRRTDYGSARSFFVGGAGLQGLNAGRTVFSRDAARARQLQRHH